MARQLCCAHALLQELLLSIYHVYMRLSTFLLIMIKCIVPLDLDIGMTEQSRGVT